ncbi:hypothetical protein chiPu_0007653 [Chiloscyllium punctatum]|uniref:Uncharacterized protein n=1 Tax=Chiloscyllium punctatum TaxID=137246 RepID=A0A401SFM8_CHIPU|nr:hypothetical protein [Chiloscyllium punctatum]
MTGRRNHTSGTMEFRSSHQSDGQGGGLREREDCRRLQLPFWRRVGGEERWRERGACCDVRRAGRVAGRGASMAV